MEVSAKAATVKKYKKKKVKKTDAEKETCLNPNLFNGMNNWMKLQKALDVVTDKNKEQASQSANYPKKHINKNHKKKKPSNKVSNEKASNKMTNEKAEFKFDFDERKATLTMIDSEVESENDGDETIRLTKSLAMDCEMVGIGLGGKESMIARVSIVNSFGDCVYDTFVKPMEEVIDYRTRVSGVRPSDLENGKDLFEVQKDVVSLTEGRRVIGHDLKHDFKALFLTHPRSLVRDTSKYPAFRSVSDGYTPSLKKLALSVLGVNIQENEHNSVEDAKIAMLLYLTVKKQWEKSLKRKRKYR